MVEQDITEQDGDLDDETLVNPIEKRESKIAFLEKKLSDFNLVQQKLKHKEQELMLAQMNSCLARNKLAHVKKK